LADNNDDIIDHESIPRDCEHRWTDVGNLHSAGSLWKQPEICKVCGVEAVTTWDEPNFIPRIRRRRQ